MAAYNKFNAFVEEMVEKGVAGAGAFDFQNDVLKVMLTNVAPTAANAVKADLTDIAAGNGYAAGGSVAATVSSAQTGGVYKLVLGDVTFTAAGGTIGPFRYVALYDDTTPSKPLIGWFDYGSAVTLNAGETFTVDFDGVNGVLTIS